jgi:hypothetical protein
MSEQWRPVPGYEGLYAVSDMGRVKSLEKHTRTNGPALQHRPERLLSPITDWTGYNYQNLSKDGTAKKIAVHTLVLLAFVGPRPDGMQCCHNNGERKDNRLCNLRWDTVAENAADRHAHGTSAIGERSAKAKLTDEMVRWIFESSQSSLAVAHAINVAGSTVRAVRLGQNWSTWLRMARADGRPEFRDAA